MNQVQQHAEGYKLAKRVARRILQQYVRWSPEDEVLYWTSYDHREVYYLVCDLFRLKREA